MRRLIIVSEHPSLHRGFATVARHVARRLHAGRRWQVECLGRYPPMPSAPRAPYACVDVDPDGAPEDGSDARLSAALRAVIDADSRPERVPLLSIGSARDQERVLDRLDDAGVRSRVTFVGYMPVDYSPLPPSLTAILHRMDVVVPFSEFGRRAIEHLCGDAPRPVVAVPVPHGVDLDTFRPPNASDRRQTRRRLWHLDDDALVIGFFGRNCRHKHPELALRIFATFARGAFVTCDDCGRITLCLRDPIDDSVTTPGRCEACASERVRLGEPESTTRLYMHSELLDRADREPAGGWDLPTLAARYGVAEQVIFDRSLRIGAGVPDEELAARMGACDIHLLPYDSGGWELTVIETAACGVPNVITDIAAPPDYAAPFAELVPAGVRVQTPVGLKGYIDERIAIEAIRRLGGDRDRRSALGRRGVEAAAAFSWERVGELWDARLAAIAPR